MLIFQKNISYNVRKLLLLLCLILPLNLNFIKPKSNNNISNDNYSLKNNIKIDMTSKVYTDLIKKIKELKKRKQKLRIQIFSHPCAGKSTFIRNNKGTYLGCKLYDYDWGRSGIKHLNIGRQYKASDLIEKNYNSVIFGSPFTISGPNSNQANNNTLEDIIYIYVIPNLKILNRNAKSRKKNRPQDKWAYIKNISKSRKKLLNLVIKDNVQIKPLFSSFKEGLNFCINAYNS